MNKKDSYQEILCLQYHGSSHHTPMPMHKRAAQFAPFDALAGFREAVRAVSRCKEKRICLADDKEEELDWMIHHLQEQLEKSATKQGLTEDAPKIRLTAFFPSEENEYGCYRTELVRAAELDISQRILITEDGKKVLFDDIIHIEII